MVKPKDKAIDGRTYRLTELDGWQQIDLFHDILALLGDAGPLIIGLVTDKPKSPDDIPIKPIFDAIPGLLMRVSKAKLRELTELLLNSCTVELPVHGGKPGRKEHVSLLPIFATEMQGRMMTVFKLLAWGMEINLGPFFAGLKGAMAARKSDAPESETPPSDSIPA